MLVKCRNGSRLVIVSGTKTPVICCEIHFLGVSLLSSGCECLRPAAEGHTRSRLLAFAISPCLASDPCGRLAVRLLSRTAVLRPARSASPLFSRTVIQPAFVWRNLGAKNISRDLKQAARDGSPTGADSVPSVPSAVLLRCHPSTDTVVLGFGTTLKLYSSR